MNWATQDTSGPRRMRRAPARAAAPERTMGFTRGPFRTRLRMASISASSETPCRRTGAMRSLQGTHFVVGELTSREATASSICRIEPAPTSGAVTTGWRRSQASATCAADAVGVRDLPDRVDDRVVGRLLGRRVEQVRVGAVRLGAYRRACVVPRAGEAAAGQRRPDDRAPTPSSRHSGIISRSSTGEEVVVVLHRHEPRPAVLLLQAQRLRELPCVHGRGAEVADLAGPHEVAECIEGLLPRGGVVVTVDLVEVDVVGAQAAQRMVDLAMIALRDSPRPLGPSRIGWRSFVAITTASRSAKSLSALAQDFLAGTVAVHVRGVEEVDPRLQRVLDEAVARPVRPWTRRGARGRARRRSSRRSRSGIRRGRSCRA